MVVLNKIYTRTGDDGTTALGSGRRVAKYDLRVEAYGTLDETNAAIGIARLHTQGRASRLDAMLARIQNDLFDLGADLCFPDETKDARGRLQVTDTQVARLESEIDTLNRELEPLRSFVLPGGSPASSYLHLARTISRRAERLMVALAARQGRDRRRRRASLYQPAVGFSVRRGALRQRQGQVRRDLGAGQEPLTRGSMYPCSFPSMTPTR